MSDSLGFARKYRPYNLDTYIGNERVRNTIAGVLARGARPKVSILGGLTGSGKTTLARIIMKEYECLNPKENGQACDECEMCQLFNRYISEGDLEPFGDDIQEINVGTKGKSDITEILESRIYMPTILKYKYFYLDEVQRASREAQDSLLKPLEEPEEHVVYILSTNEIDKLVETLRNRATLKLMIERPKEADVVKLLGSICKNEGIEFEESAFRAIGAMVGYTFRESINSMEQVISSTGKCTMEGVSAEFNVISEGMLVEFFEAYLNQDFMAYASILHRVKVEFDLKNFVSQLTEFVVRGTYIINSVGISTVSASDIAKYKNIFSKFSIAEMSFILSELLRFTQGNIEANLLNFMYSRNRFVEVATPMQEEKTVVVPEISVKDEVAIRNKNQKRINQEKEEAGLESLKTITEESSILDHLQDFPDIQKIKK